IHGWTRNPIYLGMFLLYGGIGVAARSPWTLVLTLPLAITIRYGVIAREEAYLERRVGGAHRGENARGHRWRERDQRLVAMGAVSLVLACCATIPLPRRPTMP